MLAGGVVAVAVAASGAALSVRGGDEEDPDAARLPPATTEVVRGDLAETRTHEGVLGYGTETTVTTRRAGTVTGLPEEGTVLRPGDSLVELDERPVTVLRGATPAWRALTVGSEGTDVRQLEANLRDLGYDGFDVDDDYTWATAEAVTAWQEDLGVAETGSVELGDVAFLPPARRVSSLQASLGDVLAPGQPVVGVTGTAPAVEFELTPSERGTVPVGDTVTVELPDGTSARAEIASVRTEVAPADAGDPNSDDATVVVVVADLVGKRAHRAARSYDAAAVDVVVVAGEREDVLMVPVAALLALQDGGYGVEVVSDGRSSYVAVEVGLFSDGMVEISGDGIAEGTVVGVPA